MRRSRHFEHRPAEQYGLERDGRATAGVCLKFYADLSADVSKDGVFLAHYAMSGQSAEYGQTDGQIPSQMPGQFIRLILIPCRQRELLVISSNGGGFSHIFTDITEGTSSPVITPNAPFWFFAEPGVDTTFRCALCQYGSSGNAVGKQSFWRIDPGVLPAGSRLGSMRVGGVFGFFLRGGWGEPLRGLPIMPTACG